MFDIDVLKNTLQKRQVQELQFPRRAAVSVILCGEAKQREIFFIRRAENPLDNWSGQMAFPGGGVEHSDLNDMYTAIRETREEVGIQLSEANFIGKLNHVQARKAGKLLDFSISPFVFYLEKKPNLILDHEEVSEGHWIPFQHLSNPQHHTQIEIPKHHTGLLPAIYYQDKYIWGLTYMMYLDLHHLILDL